MANPDSYNLPPNVLDKLRALEEELNEGDITQQGFEKKKAKLLAPYITSPTTYDGTGSIGSNSSSQRSISPQPPGYIDQHHMDAQARSAMVHAVLSNNTQNEVMPMSSRRNTGGGANNVMVRHNSSDMGRIDLTPPINMPPVSPPPTAPKPRRHQQQQSRQDEDSRGGGVSHKIQQLLNTLKRPKKNRRPIEEYFRDDAQEVKPIEDPTAPRPVGPTMQPVSGVPLESRQDWHRNLEAAIQHHSSTLGKQPAISVVDSHGKASVALTYSKLALRSQKVAHFLLNKLGGGKQLQPGDRVALVFRSDEAATFASTFWGCLFAAIIPVAIHPPLTRDDPGGQQIGFLLNSLGVTVAITSDITVKQLPKEEGKDYIIHFKGWPRLTWYSIDHLSKPSRDWTPPPRPSPDTTAYIEFTTDKDGQTLGVNITRSALLTHCRSLTTACQYREGEIVVCTEDSKRSIGLWHGLMAAAYNGLHVVFVSPSVMGTLPTVWLHMVAKHKATCVISSSRAISGCISLAQHKELKDVRLDGVRMILLDDGANPWSLATSDLFYEAFSPKGLSREALCPCAGSPETLTLSLRRPSPNTPSGRGVMSISGLSYGVVRVEEPGSITSLTLQDVGIVMPGARAAVVKISGLPSLCKTDEVGELCIQSSASGVSYWGLQSKSTQTFKSQPINDNDRLVQGTYVRSGLLGFVGEGGLLFVCGTMDGLIQIAGRRHNTEDLIATVMAVEPHGFIYKGRIAIFSVAVLKEERVVVVAEQKPNCTDEIAFTWMNSVVPAVESIHGINLYGIVLVSPGGLPKYPDGTIHVHDTKVKFTEGSLHPVNLLMCPYQCINNLPLPKQMPVVTGAAQMIGDLVTGRAIDPSHQPSPPSELAEDGTDGQTFEYLADALHWRATNRPDDTLFSQVDSRGHVVKSLSAVQLHKKAERIGAYILDKLKLNSGDHVALVYPPGVELVCGVYGCLYVGVVPIIVKPPAPSNLQGSLPNMKLTIEISNSRAILSTHNVVRVLKSKESGQVIDVKSLPQIFETDDPPKKKFDRRYHPPTPELIAYIDFTISTTAVLSGVKVSHSSLINMCRVHKHCTELYPSREVAVCLDPYSGLGLVFWCFSSVYCGHNTLLINPYELEINPMLWLTVLSSGKIRDTYCSYAVIDLCMRELGTSIELLKSKNINLGSLKSCVIVGEERPRTALINSFTTLFNLVGLSARAVTASFGCRVNPMICFQGPRQPDSSYLYVDSRALRLDKMIVLEKGSPHSMCLTESAKMISTSHVIIVNPETKMPCAHTEVGEIWVNSPTNGSGYYGLKKENDSLSIEHFKATLAGGSGDLSVEFARTGYLGVLMKPERSDDRTGQHNLFVIGSLEESLEVRGFRYHPIDIEATVIRSHKNIINSVVFTSNKLLVVVAEMSGDENEALDVVPVVTTSLLEEHYLVTGIVVVTDPGTIPINSRGEKQRIHLRDLFLTDEIDPIYVAYNL